MTQWPSFFLCVSTGIICEVDSQPKVIDRSSNQTPDEFSKMEEDIHRVIDQIHSLSDENTRSFRAGFNLNAYYDVLLNLYSIFQPLLKENFLDDLPKILICILSEREDCGLEGELTKTVSVELAKPLLTFLTSLRSQTCSSLKADGESNSFFRTFLRMGDSTVLSDFQQTFINILSGFSLSKNLMSVFGGLVDTAVTYILKFVALFLQVPMDYIRIALQFGIKVPLLDAKETCEQGKTLMYYYIM